MRTTREIAEDSARINALLDELAGWKTRALTAEFDATHDPMTGCLNRKGLYDAYANQAFKYAYVIDVDGLKKINDTLGHAAGDQLIKTVVTKLNAMALVGRGIVARVGGDEFILLMDKLIMTGKVEHFSHGWARINNPSGLDEALNKADTEMYTRKYSRKLARLEKI